MTNYASVNLSCLSSLPFGWPDLASCPVVRGRRGESTVQSAVSMWSCLRPVDPVTTILAVKGPWGGFVSDHGYPQAVG